MQNKKKLSESRSREKPYKLFAKRFRRTEKTFSKYIQSRGPDNIIILSFAVIAHAVVRVRVGFLFVSRVQNDNFHLGRG